MKKLLFVLLLWPYLLQAQEIFEEKGLYGLKNVAEEVWLPAQFLQILPMNDGSFLLVKQDPTQPPGIKHTNEQLQGLFLDRPDSVPAFPFQKSLLYGYVYASAIKKIVEPVYKALYFRYDGDDHLQAFDGKVYRMYNLMDSKWEKPVSEMMMEHIVPENTESYLLVKQNGKYGLLSSFFRIQHKPVYSEYEKLGSYEGYGFIMLGNASGKFVVDMDGHMLWKKPYQAVKMLLRDGSTMGIVKEGGKWGMISTESDIFYMSPQFEEAEILSENGWMLSTVMVKKQGKWGLYEAQSDSLKVPAEYDRIVYKGDGVFEGIKNGVSSIIGD
jgi:hypothetical protein